MRADRTCLRILYYGIRDELSITNVLGTVAVGPPFNLLEHKLLLLREIDTPCALTVLLSGRNYGRLR